MQDTFARARTRPKGLTAARPSALDDRVSCNIQAYYTNRPWDGFDFLPDVITFSSDMVLKVLLGVIIHFIPQIAPKEEN